MRLAKRKKKIIWASVGSPWNEYKYERRGDRPINRASRVRPSGGLTPFGEAIFLESLFFPPPISTASVLRLTLPSPLRSEFSNSSVTRTSVYSVRGDFVRVRSVRMFFSLEVDSVFLFAGFRDVRWEMLVHKAGALDSTLPFDFAPNGGRPFGRTTGRQPKLICFRPTPYCTKNRETR